MLDEQALRRVEEMRARTKQFALRVVGLFRALPRMEEADESAYWMELLIDSGIVKQTKLATLLDESNQLTLIFSASLTTARRRRD